MSEATSLDKNGRLSFPSRVGYSLGTFGESIAYNLYYNFFIFFLTDVAGVSPFAAGSISLLATTWSAVADPVIGHLSDKSKHPKGRRRPFILRYSVPLGIAIVLLFTDLGLSGAPQVFYFVIANILFWIGVSAVDIPYMVLGGEITRVHNERLSLRWLCNSFNYIGYAVVGFAVYLVAIADEIFKDPSTSWTAVAVLFGLACALTFLISAISTKGKEPLYNPEEVVDHTNLFKSIFKGCKIKPYRNVMLYTLFVMCGIMIYTSDQMYLFTYYLQATDAQIANIYVVYSIMVVILSPVMSAIGRKLGNRTTLLISIALISIGFGVYWVIPFNMYTVWGILFACAIGVAGFFVNSYAMVYDVADVAELKSGIKNEGILLAFFSFCLKMATALAMWLLGVFLAYYQYDPELEMTESVLKGIKTSGTIIPAVICAISFIFIFKYSLTDNNMKLLRQLKADKESGIEVDLSIVDKLL